MSLHAMIAEGKLRSMKYDSKLFYSQSYYDNVRCVRIRSYQMEGNEEFEVTFYTDEYCEEQVGPEVMGSPVNMKVYDKHSSVIVFRRDSAVGNAQISLVRPVNCEVELSKGLTIVCRSG